MNLNLELVKNELNVHLVVYRVRHYNQFKRCWEDIGEAISYPLAESILKSSLFFDDVKSNYKIVKSFVFCGTNKDISFVQSHFVNE